MDPAFVDSLPPAPLRAPPMGRIGRFELLGKLATGGMAEIFVARERAPHGATRDVVLKRLLPHIASEPRFVDMFVLEAKLSMHLRHPNICSIYEFGEHLGSCYLALEWVRGVTLRELADRAAQSGGIPLPMVVKIISDVAAALHHAHTAKAPDGSRLNIVHRDVTPENVMIGFDGSVKLLDFGIAKAATQLRKTQAGVLKGKFGYMSPEQYQGAPADARSDVFSLGVCLYEAITNEPLFERASEFETVAAILMQDSVPQLGSIRPGVPPAFDQVVGVAVAKNPAQRFSSARDMQEALGHALEQQQRWDDLAMGELVRRLFADEVRVGPRLERVASFPLREVAVPPGGPDRHALDAELDQATGEFAKASRFKGWLLALAALALTVSILLWLGRALTQPQSAPAGSRAEARQARGLRVGRLHRPVDRVKVSAS